jgi:hypothetical protein
MLPRNRAREYDLGTPGHTQELFQNAGSTATNPYRKSNPHTTGRAGVPRQRASIRNHRFCIGTHHQFAQKVGRARGRARHLLKIWMGAPQKRSREAPRAASRATETDHPSQTAPRRPAEAAAVRNSAGGVECTRQAAKHSVAARPDHSRARSKGG